MDKELLNRLTEKINNGSASDQELSLFNAYMNSLAHAGTDWSAQYPGGSEAVKKELSALIGARIAYPEKPRTYLWKRIAVAASVVLCIAAGGYFMMHRDAPETRLTATNPAQTVKPGGNKATLTLADGRTLVLSSAQTGIIAGPQITYTNGTPVEDAVSVQPHSGQQLLLMETPRGGTYTITLADGTQVWLNAETSLKYPAQFDENERVVELKGEAYFQVKTTYDAQGKKIPFRVVSDQQTVEVLGTQFNMCAYPDQPSVKTTLVEGLVAVTARKGRSLLKPNEQAVTQKGETQVKAVNVYPNVAWREGKFSFDGKTLEETLNEIGRWYDLKIVYEDGVPQEELTGDAFRNQNINFIFRLLDVAKVNYKLDIPLRRLTILKKK